MTALNNTPDNKNFLSPLNFKFQIKKAPHVNFFIQKVNIPNIVLASPVYPNPMVKIPIPGEHIDYGKFEISWKVDEDLTNYLEIHNWIKALGKPEDFEGRREITEKPIYSGEGITSEISLAVLSSNKTPNYEIVIHDAHPVSLSSIVFDTTSETVNYVTASAEFRYTYYDIQRST
jgi:hypothetical protein